MAVVQQRNELRRVLLSVEETLRGNEAEQKALTVSSRSAPSLGRKRNKRKRIEEDE